MTAIFNGNSLDFIDEGVIISTTDGYSSKNVSPSLNGIFSLNSSNPTIDNVIYNNSTVSEYIHLYATDNSLIINQNNALRDISPNYGWYVLQFPTMNGFSSINKALYCTTIVNNACTFNMHYNTTYMQEWGSDITGDWIIFPVTIPTSFAEHIISPNRVLMSIRVVIHYDNCSNSDAIEYNTSGKCGWFSSAGDMIVNAIPFTGMARYSSNSDGTTIRELHILITLMTSNINYGHISYTDFAIVFNSGILDTTISSATGSLMFTIASF